MNADAYWDEVVETAATECGLTFTREQIENISGAVRVAHENYGLAFYTPPASDRLREIEQKHERRIKELKDEFQAYREDAEKAVKIALKCRPDDHVSIQEYGEVFLHGERIQ